MTLSEICRTMLDILNEEDSLATSASSIREIHSIILASQRLFYVENGRRILLSSEFDWHPIWRRVEMWKGALQIVINRSFSEAVLNLQKQKYEKDIKVEEEKSFFSKALDIFKEKPSEFTFQGNSMRIPKTLAQTIVYTLQQTFITYFLSFKMTFEASREVLLHFCRKYEIDQQRTHLLLHELEAGQHHQVCQITFAD